jgi:hypothetical protein
VSDKSIASIPTGFSLPTTVSSTGGVLSVKVPELLPQRSHAQNIGDDVAFKIVRKGDPIDHRP